MTNGKRRSGRTRRARPIPLEKMENPYEKTREQRRLEAEADRILREGVRKPKRMPRFE
jgi:hypothetical protein